MLKKLVCLFIALIVGMMCNVSLAEEEDIYSDFYTISNKRVVSQNDERIVISFDITNNTSNYYPELYFTPTLKVTGEEGVMDYYYSKYYDFDWTKFSLNSNETKPITLKLNLPGYLPNRKCAISVNVETLTHRVSYSPETFFLGNIIENNDGFLDTERDSYWKLSNNDFVQSATGPNVSADDLPKAYLKLKSNFDSSVKVYPHYVVYERSSIYNSTPIYDEYGDEIKFKSGETKELFLDVPRFDKPESYLLNLNFTDEAGNVISNTFDFRYVIIGESAKINSIVLYKDKIKTYIYGPSDGTALDVDFSISIYDEKGNIIKNEEKSINIGGEKDCFITEIGSTNSKIIKVIAEVSSNGNILVTKEEKIEVEREEGKQIFSDIIGTKYENAVKTLNGLGIINGYPDNTFKPENKITRAEFSTIVTKLLGLDIGADTDVIFNDVENHWAKPYINRSYKEGIVSGYPDGTFMPQNNVTYAESITMLLNAMGYKEEIKNSTLSWPYNYIDKATEIELNCNIDVEDYNVPANRGDISLLTLNAYLLK